MAAGATYTPIATTTLGSAVSSYTFSSIPSTYTDLIVIFAGTIASSEGAYTLQFNSDTGSNYSTTFLYGDGSAASSGRVSNQTTIYAGRATTTQGNGIAHIQNYSNATTYKTVISRGNNSSLTIAYVGLWRSTAAINSIKIANETGSNLSSGSTFTLYGIAAA
jgi:hypothetical protein